MNLYDKYVLPKVIDWTCKQNPNKKQRQKVVPWATGNVLEIGIGSGLNLPFYGNGVQNLVAIDPSVEIWNENKVNTETLPFSFNFVKAIAEDIPEDNNCFDSVVTTYTLCSIPDIKKAFDEIKRVLKPNGKLIFCEHGKAPDRSVQKWQNTINPIWKKFGGGCSLKRDIPLLIEGNGLKIQNIDTMYIPGWKPASFNYWGIAELK